MFDDEIPGSDEYNVAKVEEVPDDVTDDEKEKVTSMIRNTAPDDVMGGDQTTDEQINETGKV